jgi:hypothetical protein
MRSQEKRMRKHHPFCSATLILIFALLSLCLASSQDDLDFSKTNSVTILLAEADSLPGHGLEMPCRHAAARSTVINVEGVPCRYLHLTDEGYSKGYFCFRIDPTFKTRDVKKVKVEVDYFDGFAGQLGVFGVQYDATGSDGPNPKYKQVYPNVPVRGSKKWLKATFHINDAVFQSSQNGEADFRLWASPPELCVSRVTVTLEPLQQSLQATDSLAFNAAGEAKLTEWNVQWDAGSKPSFSSNTGNQNGLRWLEIRGPGAFAVGSWRTTALLAAGEYQFVGKVRTDGLEIGTGAEQGGVTLRMSWRSAPKLLSQAPDWTSLNYDFMIGALEQVELVCEFRGSEGSARFDLDSLKLIRKK